MDTQLDHCEFCDEFSGGTHNSFAERFHEDRMDRTVIETESLRVVPTLGQIAQGYLLIVPRHHCCAIADLPAEFLREVEQLKTRLAGSLRDTYGQYVFFEHGVRTQGSGGCGISHAHLHAIPVGTEQDPIEKLKAAFPHKRVPSLSRLGDILRDVSYLYYEDTRGECHVFYPQFLPSQYMRRILAEALGVQQWDWRTSGREESVLVTKANVSVALRDVPAVSECVK
jgi:diadenosine tetraphosphate (Ap4A) HIT family hydrolase